MQMVLKFRAPVEMKLPKSFVFESCHPPPFHCRGENREGDACDGVI